MQLRRRKPSNKWVEFIRRVFTFEPLRKWVGAHLLKSKLESMQETRKGSELKLSYCILYHMPLYCIKLHITLFKDALPRADLTVSITKAFEEKKIHGSEFSKISPHRFMSNQPYIIVCQWCSKLMSTFVITNSEWVSLWLLNIRLVSLWLQFLANPVLFGNIWWVP